MHEPLAGLTAADTFVQDQDPPPLLSAAYWAVRESGRRVRQDLAAVAASVGASAYAIENVRLAASEAITLVVASTYRADVRLAHVTAALRRRSLLVTILAEGEGAQEPPEDPDVELGLLLMKACSDELSIQRPPQGGIKILMSFRLRHD